MSHEGWTSIVRATVFSEPAHVLVHAMMCLLPDASSRRIHDWHAMRVFNCSPEEAASSAPPEGIEMAFYRGYFCGAMGAIVAMVTWWWVAR